MTIAYKTILRVLMRRLVNIITIAFIIAAASCGGSSSESPVVLKGLIVKQENEKVVVGQSFSLNVTGVFSDDSRRDVSSTVHVEIDDEQKARVIESGRIELLEPGTVTVTITDSVTGIKKIIVIEILADETQLQSGGENSGGTVVVTNPSAEPKPVTEPVSGGTGSDPVPDPGSENPTDPQPVADNCSSARPGNKTIGCQTYPVKAGARYRATVAAVNGTTLPVITELTVEIDDATHKALCQNVVIFSPTPGPLIQCDFALNANSSVSSVAVGAQTLSDFDANVTVQLSELMQNDVSFVNDALKNLLLDTAISGTVAYDTIKGNGSLTSTYEIPTVTSSIPYRIYLYNYSNKVPFVVETIDNYGNVCECPSLKECNRYNLFEDIEPNSRSMALVCQVQRIDHKKLLIQVKFDDPTLSDEVYLPARVAGGASYKLIASKP